MTFSLAHPLLLALFILTPIALLLFRVGSKRRATAIGRFGNPESLGMLVTAKRSSRLASQIFLTLAIMSLILALTGPRWGKGDSGVMAGRDLIIVLDFSKSMLADDMRDPEGGQKERWQAARQSIRELAESLRGRGGYRLGLVEFAAKPWVVVPPTTDMDHFLARLEEFTPLWPPPEVNPGPGEQFPSGTRIGAAIEEAVRVCDNRFAGFVEILLISDGDDPADDRDREIELGIRAAREARLSVNVVGIGDPDIASTVSYRRGDGEEEIVGPTRLVQTPLKEIARQTGGVYFSAQRERPDLVDFSQAILASKPTRELNDDLVPQPRDRSIWFLLPAAALLFLAWMIEP